MSDAPVSWNPPATPVRARDGEQIGTREGGRYEIHNHFHHDYRDRRVEELLGMVAALSRQVEAMPGLVLLATSPATQRLEDKIMALIDDFRNVASQLGTVKESFAAAFGAIQAKLDAALADDLEQAEFKAQIVGVRDEIQGKVGELVNLAAENTPAAAEPTPAEPMPVEPTPSEPAPAEPAPAEPVAEQPAPAVPAVPAPDAPPPAEQPAPDAPPALPTS